MKRLFQGIAFILFGMLLVLIAMVDPVLSDGILRMVADLVALIMGIVGLVYTLTPGKLELVVSPGNDIGGIERTGY